MIPNPLIRGGSGAVVTLGDGFVVKVPTDDGVTKLAAEGAWLQWIQGQSGVDEVRGHFPRVRAVPTTERPALVLEALPGRTARTVVLGGGGDDLLPLLIDAITFAFERLPRATTHSSSWATGEWCASHLEQSVRRAASIHTEVGEAIAREALCRGREFAPNRLHLAPAIESLRPLVSPCPMVLHGDLHLGNVLVGIANGSFAFVDPRGGWDGAVTFDPAYDVAKLLHEPAYLCAQIRDPTADQRARLIEIVNVSQALARHACGILEAADPMVAARATLMTGMHLTTVLRLPHTIAYDVPSFLASAAGWLAAGVGAVREKKPAVACYPVWTRLYGQMSSSFAVAAG